MKKVLLIFLAVWMLSACNNIERFNDNPKAVTVVPAGALLINAEKELSDNLSEMNAGTNSFRLFVQQWAQTTYTDESNYFLAVRKVPQIWWHGLYRDVLKDLAEAKKVAQEDVTITEAVRASQLAIIEVMTIYTYEILVSTYGNVPYTEALDFDNLEPKYDDAATIYNDLLTRLDAAIAGLSEKPGDLVTYDILYHGDVSSWLRFANSLKLKMGMTLADVDPSKAKSVVESAAPNVFKSNIDNATFKYLGARPNNNPMHDYIVLRNRKDYVGADTFIDAMNNLDDPRRSAYFTASANGISFVGGVYGAGNNFASLSKPGAFANDPTTPSVYMDYAEVEFFLAEAAARGMSVGGSAEEHYNKAITASMEYWGVSASDMSDYMTQSAVAYGTAAGDYKQKIGMQKWFGIYNRGFASWREWRRLDVPTLVAPPTANGNIPTRFTYPTSEQNLNAAQYDAAVSAMGGSDVVDGKVFWDMQ